MTLPLSYLAYQLLSLAAGLGFYRAVRSLVVRPGTSVRRRMLIEGVSLGTAGLVLLLIGRLCMPWLGSTALFLPVGAIFHGIVVLAAPVWLWRGVRARCGLSALGALAVLLLGIVVLFVEPERLVVRRLQIQVSAPYRGARPVRIAHVTDLQTVGACRREQRALEAIAAFQPDLILLTGDYATGGEDAQQRARAFLEVLSAPAGIFAVRGNAENEREMARLMEGLPICWLVNGGKYVEVAGCELYIAGLEHSQPLPGEALRERSRGGVTVLLSHAPDTVLELERGGHRVDLVLSGHTHGGQIEIPWIGPPLTLSALERRYASGLHRRGGSVEWLFVGRGLGMEGRFAPRMRLGCPPEIALIELGIAAPANRMGRASTRSVPSRFPGLVPKNRLWPDAGEARPRDDLPNPVPPSGKMEKSPNHNAAGYRLSGIGVPPLFPEWIRITKTKHRPPAEGRPGVVAIMRHAF